MTRILDIAGNVDRKTLENVHGGLKNKLMNKIGTLETNTRIRKYEEENFGPAEI